MQIEDFSSDIRFGLTGLCFVENMTAKCSSKTSPRFGRKAHRDLEELIWVQVSVTASENCTEMSVSNNPVVLKPFLFRLKHQCHSFKTLHFKKKNRGKICRSHKNVESKSTYDARWCLLCWNDSTLFCNLASKILFFLNYYKKYLCFIYTLKINFTQQTLT